MARILNFPQKHKNHKRSDYPSPLVVVVLTAIAIGLVVVTAIFVTKMPGRQMPRSSETTAQVDSGTILAYYEGKGYDSLPRLYAVIDFESCGTRYVDSETIQFPGEDLKWGDRVRIVRGCNESFLRPVIFSQGKWSTNS